MTMIMSGTFPLNGSSVILSNHTQIGPPNSTTTLVSTTNDALTAPISIGFAVLTVVFNGLILTSFVQHSHLRTPFSVYVISLAALDILNALVPMSMPVIKQQHGQWPLGAIACTAGLYLSQLSNTGNRAIHLLIAGNRLWAVTSPVTYRNRHSIGLAVGLVMLGWSLTSCLVIPEIVLTRQTFNHSWSAADPACAYDRRRYPALDNAFNMVLYIAPEVIILIAYPGLVCKLHQNRRNRVKNEPVTSRALSSKTQHRKLASTSRPEQTGQTGQAVSEADRQRSRSRTNDRLFAYLVISVIVCWTPNNVFYLYASLTNVRIPWLSTVQYFLGYANSWLNPILIYMADSQIRRAVNGLAMCNAL